MNHYEEILNVLFDAIRDYNSQESELKLTPARETPLLGGTARLDSVAVVVFSSIVEEHVERKLGQTVSVLDIFGAAGDYLDIGGLTDRIARKLGRAVA